MNSEERDYKPVYEQPGILDPERNVPNSKSPEFRIVTHYNEEAASYPDTNTSFTDTSANSMEPIEDFDLINGNVRPKVVGGGNAGKITPRIMPNMDPMAGGALPTHSKAAFKAGNPSFFTDPVKLILYTVLMLLVVAAEAFLLIWLIR